MIRVVVFLLAAGALALGVVWLADRPGQIAITWLGYRTDTSVMVAVDPRLSKVREPPAPSLSV